MTSPSLAPRLAHTSVREALKAECGTTTLPDSDPEVSHFIVIEERLSADQAGYIKWISYLGAQRLHARESQAALAGAVATLTNLADRANLGPYAYGEALQICLSDLELIEELDQADLPARTVWALRQDLVAKSLDLVVRIIRNLGTRARTLRVPGQRSSGSDVFQLSMLKPGSPAEITLAADEPVLVVATAGRGTRVRSTIPKGLVPVGGMPMIAHVVEAARMAGIAQTVFILKHGAAVQSDYLSRWGSAIVQDRAEGTGHSAFAALASLGGHRAPVVLSFSDLPFLTADSFKRPMEVLESTGADLVLSTFVPPAPGTGVVLRNDTGAVTRVVQQRFGDAGNGESDGGLYVLRRDPAFEAFGRIRNDNVRREFALPDVVPELTSDGARVETAIAPATEFQSVNTPGDLSLARLRAASGGSRDDDWLDQNVRNAAVAYFASRGGGKRDDQDLIGYGLTRIETQVGPILDLGSEWL